MFTLDFELALLSITRNDTINSLSLPPLYCTAPPALLLELGLNHTPREGRRVSRPLSSRKESANEQLTI